MVFVARAVALAVWAWVWAAAGPWGMSAVRAGPAAPARAGPAPTPSPAPAPAAAAQASPATPTAPGALFLQAAGLQLAAVGLRHEVVAYTPSGVRRLAVGRPGDEVTEVAAAPLASRLFAVVRTSCQAGQRRVSLMAADLSGEAPRAVRSARLSCDPEQGLHMLAVVPSPDGTRVAWAVTGVDWSGWRVARWDGTEEALPSLPAVDEGLCRVPDGFAGGWPLAWSPDGRYLYAVDFQSDSRSIQCVRRLDVQARTMELAFAAVVDAQADGGQGLRPVRSSLEELARRLGQAAMNLYGLATGAPESLLRPLGGGLRRPKSVASPDGRVVVNRDWGDLVASEGGRERARLVGVVSAPPDCFVEDVCIDPEDLWTVAWARPR